MTTKAAELETVQDVQDAFNLALKRSMDTVASLRRQRRIGTSELTSLGYTLALNKKTDRPKRPSKIQVSVSGSGSDFQSILLLMRRLKKISSIKDGEIVCIDKALDFRNGHGESTCNGLRSFWTRAGKEPPPVRYTNETLDQVLEQNPVAVLMAPKEAPEKVPGYIKTVLEEPHVCFLLRREE